MGEKEKMYVKANFNRLNDATPDWTESRGLFSVETTLLHIVVFTVLKGPLIIEIEEKNYITSCFWAANETSKSSPECLSLVCPVFLFKFKMNNNKLLFCYYIFKRHGSQKYNIWPTRVSLAAANCPGFFHLVACSTVNEGSSDLWKNVHKLHICYVFPHKCMCNKSQLLKPQKNEGDC